MIETQLNVKGMTCGSCVAHVNRALLDIEGIEKVLRDAGTFMYHSHYDEMTQIALGLKGMFVVHPKRPLTVVDHDFVLMTHEWKLPVGATRPDPNEMGDFNLLTFNGKAFPATEPLLVGTGPEEPGDWAMHCHMTHHVMSQMGHGLPNVVGADLSKVDRRMSRILPEYVSMGTAGGGGMGEMEMPIPPNSLPMKGGMGPFSYIDMGGMFTLLKVRDDVQSADKDGWYQHPAGTVPGPASADQARADGVSL